MTLQKSQYEAFAQFFETPKRETLREVIKTNIGETDYCDFKEEWPVYSKFSKHVLALANSGGGAIVLGIKQNADGTITATGLPDIKEKSDIFKSINNYIPDSLHENYIILDFSYSESEYPLIKGKKFQVVLVEYDSKNLPYVSLKDGDGIRANTIYVRQGTESKQANHKQIEKIINNRLESGHSSSHILNLKDHLEQIQVLYKEKSRKSSVSIMLNSITSGLSGNPYTEYFRFIESRIERKQVKIDDILGI